MSHDIQKIEDNHGQIAQNVMGNNALNNYGEQVFNQTNNYISFKKQINDVRDDYLKNFGTILGMWGIEIDYHFRLLFYYNNNQNKLYSFVEALYEFNDLYFNTLFKSKLKEYFMNEKTAKHRIKYMHRKLNFTKENDIFIKLQYVNNFEAFFVNLPEKEMDTDDIVMYGTYITIYNYILDNNMSDKYILDICSHTFFKLKKDNYNKIDEIIDIAIKEQDRLIKYKSN